jgi:hypothetical protein
MNRRTSWRRRSSRRTSRRMTSWKRTSWRRTSWRKTMCDLCSISRICDPHGFCDCHYYCSQHQDVISPGSRARCSIFARVIDQRGSSGRARSPALRHRPSISHPLLHLLSFQSACRGRSEDLSIHQIDVRSNLAPFQSIISSHDDFAGRLYQAETLGVRSFRAEITVSLLINRDR